MNIVNFKKYKQRYDEQIAMAKHQQLSEDENCVVEQMQKAIEAGCLRLPK